MIRNLCLELSTFLYKLARQEKDLRWKRYLAEEAHKIAKEEIADRDTMLANLTMAILKLDIANSKKDREIERLNTILRVSFSPLASEQL